MAIIFFVALFSNAVVLVALWRQLRRKPSSRMYRLMLHLSVADLLVALLHILPQIMWDITYRWAKQGLHHVGRLSRVGDHVVRRPAAVTGKVHRRCCWLRVCSRCVTITILFDDVCTGRMYEMGSWLKNFLALEKFPGFLLTFHGNFHLIRPLLKFPEWITYVLTAFCDERRWRSSKINTTKCVWR